MGIEYGAPSASVRPIQADLCNIPASDTSSLFSGQQCVWRNVELAP